MEIQAEWNIPGNLEQVTHSMSHREYLLRKRYLQEKNWGEPNKTEYYLMQIAQAVKQVLAKNPKRVKLSHFKMKFRKKGEGKRMTAQQRKLSAGYAKARWFGIAGLSPDGKKRDA